MYKSNGNFEIVRKAFEESETDAEFMEDYRLVQEVTSASGDNTILPIENYPHFITDEVYRSQIIRNAMVRDRFELILKFLHFSDNHKCHSYQGRLPKWKLLLYVFTERPIFVCILKSELMVLNV